MKGQDVRLLQDSLELLGYSIPINEKERGYLGTGTRKAVIEFQKCSSLAVTGVVDKETRNELKAIQRVFNITPSYPEMSGLLEDDLHSALQIVDMPENTEQSSQKETKYKDID